MRRSFLLAIAAAALAGCEPKNEFQPPPPSAVTVAVPLRRDVTEWFETTGATRAVQTAELRAKVGGYLKEVRFKDGQLVKNGDVLFEIEKAPFETALASANAELAKAEAQLKLSIAQLGRTKALIERKAGTKDQLDVAEAERTSAEAEVAAKKAAIKTATLNLGYAEVKAPFAGRMGRNLIDVGNLVQVGTTVLATLESVDPIYAYFNLSEAELLRFLKMQEEGSLKPITEADPLPVQMALGETGKFSFKGTLDYRAFGVDPQTGTTERRAVFKNDDQRLIPGLFVRVRAAVGEPKPRLLVEERALSSDQRGDYLLVVNAKNVVEQRPVELGPSDAGLRVILSGLKPDEKVVINGLQRARPGAEVKPETAVMGASLTAQPTAFRISPEGPAVAKRPAE